jgi:hypothetical protein
LKLDCPCSSSSSSELEITNDVYFIENFEKRIKSIEELKIEENLKSILDNLKDQLSSIEKLSEDSQDYLSKDIYEKQIETFLPTVPNSLSAWLPGGADIDLPYTLFHYYNTGVDVYGQNPNNKIFQIDKTNQYFRLGDHSNNIGTVLVVVRV